jgi:putative methionine-R-sulfoxide reductase with GAF domain/Tfp pilus assembly protein PilZ
MEPLGTHTAISSNLFKAGPRGRRRAVRQKAHTPAYASLNGGFDDMVLDLSEILNISESGAAIQTSSSWEISRELNLCLDLSETKTYLHTTGQVIWADRSGRIGVRFPELPEDSRRKLQEWLFLNAMVGAANFVARNGETSASYRNMLAQRSYPSLASANAQESRADYTATLTALSAVQREVESLGTNLAPALQLIAERARIFTNANGCAIALSENDEMVCRASAGDAPPIGARLDTNSGFSGYCARTGFLQRCDDSETDLHVDRESCRALGIRSMIAVPIRLGETVIGLLEVFSSTDRAFNDRHGTILQRLADTTLAAVNRHARAQARARAQNPPERTPVGSAPTFSTASYPFASALKEAERPSTDDTFPRGHLALLVVAALSIVAVLAYLLSPWALDRFRRPKAVEAAPAQVQPAAEVESAPVNVPPPAKFEEMHKRAEVGDPYEQAAVANHYASGEDVPKDYSMAVRWYLRAAEQGHVGAQDALGSYFWMGRGVPKDVTRAYFWSIVARDEGKETSKNRVSLITPQLTRGQVQAIEREATKFRRQHPPLQHSDAAD